MSSIPTLLGSLIVGGIVFVVLFVILSVTLWVSIVAGGVVALLSMFGGAGAMLARRGSHPHPHGT
jgi:hypothetical protein